MDPMAKRKRTATTSPSKKRAAFAFKPREWMPLIDAFARVRVAMGSRRLAERDLQRDLCGGRLASAARWSNRRTGEDTSERLPPAFWESALITSTSAPEGGVRVTGVSLPGMVNGYFYILRSDLDKYYPAPGTDSVDAGPPTVRADHPTTRRKPGPKPQKNWQVITAREVILTLRAGGEVPSAAEMCTRCERLCGYHPDIRAMQKYLKDLGALD
jgi:hypothetical protein